MKYLVQPVMPSSATFPGVLPTTREKTFSLAASHSGQVISVKGGSAVVEQRKWDENDQQRWKIEAVSSFTVPNSLDAALYQGSKCFFFKGDEYVRFNFETQQVDEGYPRNKRDEASSWSGFPENFRQSIDAALYVNSRYCFFFKGDEYLRFDFQNNRVDDGYPKKIKDSGSWSSLPANFHQGIDAVLYQGNKCFFFKGDEYARFDFSANRMDHGYPRKIKDSGSWSSLPANFHQGIDVALYNNSRYGFFFKGDEYARFDFQANRMDDGYPRKIKDSTSWSKLPAHFYQPIVRYYVRIVSESSGKVMAVYGNSSGDGAHIVEEDWNGSDSQQWILESLGAASYKIVSKSTGKVLDVENESRDAGAQVIQSTWNEKLSQRWQLSQANLIAAAYAFDPQATIYQHGNYQGHSQVLGLGAYKAADLSIGNEQLSSLRVPDGLRVTLFENDNYKGERRSYTSDTSFVGDFNDKTSAIAVEKVATLYQDKDYQGKSAVFGVGVHRLRDSELGNNSISSLKVPQGLMVILYESDNFAGKFRVFTENSTLLGDDLDNQVSSLVVKMMGVEIPKGVLKYGYDVALKSKDNLEFLAADSQGNITTSGASIGDNELFTLVRAGDTRYDNYVSYGDIVALRSQSNQYLVANSNGTVGATTSLTDAAKFAIVRTGTTLSKTFVAVGDSISLRTYNEKFLVINSSGTPQANVTAEETLAAGPGCAVNAIACGAEASLPEDTSFIGLSGKWIIRTKDLEQGEAVTQGAVIPGAGSICASQVGGVGVCGTDLCAANACGAAACVVAGSLVGVCGAAAAVIAFCGGDACGLAAGGALGCGLAVAATAACGGDACGAAACGGAACGAAACGVAGCGLAAGLTGVCGMDASFLSVGVVDICATEASVIDACAFDACAANACFINLCPADACAADACLIDLIPIIPGI